MLQNVPKICGRKNSEKCLSQYSGEYECYKAGYDERFFERLASKLSQFVA